jgi:hypothetical protein
MSVSLKKMYVLLEFTFFTKFITANSVISIINTWLQMVKKGKPIPVTSCGGP